MQVIACSPLQRSLEKLNSVIFSPVEQGFWLHMTAFAEVNCSVFVKFWEQKNTSRGPAVLFIFPKKNR